MNTQTRPAEAATERQLQFISDLYSAIDPDNAAESMLSLREAIEAGEGPSKADATKFIKGLIATRDKKRAETRAQQAPAPKAQPAQQDTSGLDEGFYRAEDGSIYQVVQARHGSHLLAKRLNPETGAFDYAGAARRFVKPAQRMTLEDAKAYGKQTGSCMVCGRKLTAAASVEAGIGPVCAKRF